MVTGSKSPHHNDANQLLPADCLIRKTLLGGGLDATRFLQGVPLFKRLPETEIPVLAQAMCVKTFHKGTVKDECQCLLGSLKPDSNDYQNSV